MLELATLKDKIPEEACTMIIRVTDPAEAWERLNGQYGDEQLAAIAAMKELMQIKIPAVLPFVKIGALGMAVRLAKTRLRAIGKERQLYASVFTFSTLVKKLKLTAQSSWCGKAEFPSKLSKHGYKSREEQWWFKDRTR